jgi:hypothetical protein
MNEFHCNYPECKQEVKYRLCLTYHRYNVDKDGNYSNEKTWDGGISDWYCEEHAKHEGII